MSRVLVVPDAHTKIWVIEHGMELADKLRANHVVLLGDYFDDWEAKPKDNLNMLKYLKDLLRHHTNVVPLFGNHELSYMGFPCSGHMLSVGEQINDGISADRRFLFAVAFDSVLYSHAGVMQSWIRNNKILSENSIRKQLGSIGGANVLESAINGIADVALFNQVGCERGGNTTSPSCLWADLRELINDPIPKVKQIVGHTPISNVEMLSNCWFCDVMSNDNQCDEYVFVIDGEPTIVSYGEVCGGE